MKNYVFHLVCKKSSVVSAPKTPLPIVDAASGGEPAARNDLLLIFKLPATAPNVAVSAVLDAKKRGWNPPIDQLSFFLNRTEDVFLIDWSIRRLLTRSTFDALKNRGKIDASPDDVPFYVASNLDKNPTATETSGSSATVPNTFEYLAFGDLDAFLSVDERRYFGSQTLSVD